MKTFSSIVFCVLLVGLCACGGKTRTLSPKETQETVQEVGKIERDHILAQADQSISVALAYFDQHGYEKSAELFIRAADMYQLLPWKAAERQTLIAAAKVQLKAGNRDAFMGTMIRFRSLIEDNELPAEEERFFVNLCDQMRGVPLGYPVKDVWRTIFK